MDPVAVCAETTAAWHASWLNALGLRWERREGVWRALDAPPAIYWTGITLSPTVREDALADAQGVVCDSWSSIDLAGVGFEERMREPWFLRRPGELPSEEAPTGLEVVHVATPTEVEEFEAVSVRGFGGDDAAVEPATFHPPSVLADRRMVMLVGPSTASPWRLR